MKIKKGTEKKYKNWYDNNLDPYGHACFTYAERWAEMMELKINESGSAEEAIINNAERLSHEADKEGITCFMYGVAVKILSYHWEYGDILRKWHNKEYDYEGDGVVNPALMTIGGKKMPKLKPCPFCGWRTIVDGGFLNHKCTCNSCGASTKGYPTWELAIKAWNKRAGDSDDD